jgi:hypothetical protein
LRRRTETTATVGWIPAGPPFLPASRLSVPSSLEDGQCKCYGVLRRSPQAGLSHCPRSASGKWKVPHFLLSFYTPLPKSLSWLTDAPSSSLSYKIKSNLTFKIKLT